MAASPTANRYGYVGIDTKKWLAPTCIGFSVGNIRELFDPSPQRQGKGKLQRGVEKKIKFSVVEYAHTHSVRFFPLAEIFLFIFFSFLSTLRVAHCVELHRLLGWLSLTDFVFDLFP